MLPTWLQLALVALGSGFLTMALCAVFIRWWYSQHPDEGMADRERLADLELRVKALEASEKSLLLQWDDTFNKIRRLVGRLDKTRALDEKKYSETAETPQDELDFAPAQEPPQTPATTAPQPSPPGGDRFGLLASFTRKG